MRFVLLVFALLPWVNTAWAHDFLTTETVDSYLAQATQQLGIYRSGAPAPKRAEAAYRLGRLLDEIREFLNRDIAAHGQVQGLASNRLVLELKSRGVPLQQFAGRRFAANLAYYRDVLALTPQGEHEADALLQLIKGHFYDSFDDDPVTPRRQTSAQLREQITFAERLLARAPDHPEAEEARFILLVHYLQAALATNDASARSYGGKARIAMTDFERRYPESLRSAAIPALREKLDSR